MSYCPLHGPMEDAGWELRWKQEPGVPVALLLGVAGHDDRYAVVPNISRPELFLLSDEVRQVMVVVNWVPTPQEAMRLLRRHGIPIAETTTPRELTPLSREASLD